MNRCEPSRRGRAGLHTSAMPPDAAAAARLRAYSLLEAAQGHAPEDALAALVTLEAEATVQGWEHAAFLAAAGRTVHAIVRRERPVAEELVADLVERAEAVGTPALRGIALALRAVTAARREDSAALLADAGRAVVLVDDASLPALDRCCALVVCAAAYNTLSLWELVDELYDRASDLAPACEQPMMQPAVTVDRVLLRLEWATALLELGEERQALDQLHRAGDAVRLAVAADLPEDLWRLDVLACGDLVPFVLSACGEPVDGAAGVDDALAVLDAHRETLVRHRGRRGAAAARRAGRVRAAPAGPREPRRGPGCGRPCPTRPRPAPGPSRPGCVPRCSPSSAGATGPRRGPRRPPRVRPARVPGPVGRTPGGARRRPRHDRHRAAQRRARRAVPRRAAGPVDRAVQPAGLRRLAPGRPGHRAGDRAAAHRPGRLQGGQRPARARGRRRGAAAGGPGGRRPRPAR